MIDALNYTLTIYKANEATGDAYHTNLTGNFEIAPNNDPPIMGTVSDKLIVIPNGLNWTYGASFVTDHDSPELETTLEWNDTETLPSWITFDNSTFTFNISSTSDPDIGNHKFTLVADDDYNFLVKGIFYIEILPNEPPEAQEPISDVEVVIYHNLEVLFEDINTLFVDPHSLSFTTSMSQLNNNSLPSFLSYDSSSNKLTGTPTVDDIGNWNLKLTATNSKTMQGYIPFVLRVKGKMILKFSSKDFNRKFNQYI